MTRDLAGVLSRELLRQLGACGMDGGGFVGVDSTRGYDGDASIDCFKLADVVLEAMARSSRPVSFNDLQLVDPYTCVHEPFYYHPEKTSGYVGECVRCRVALVRLEVERADDVE
ncbi:hypothetical protein IU451_28750 [Nocardia cyriacigeorgica]|uniref:hypothetical protein n=1 Tax=Nocardia cyriacigeorgica TaxID=135487 RepID=UPI0018930395|nr:hypothetical protein [Nocardia cyriacigeorgica]MBF6326492.1 hypothetical protein [Nocardia cyriacigeorgica]